MPSVPIADPYRRRRWALSDRAGGDETGERMSCSGAAPCRRVGTASVMALQEARQSAVARRRWGSDSGLGVPVDLRFYWERERYSILKLLARTESVHVPSVVEAGSRRHSHSTRKARRRLHVCTCIKYINQTKRDRASKPPHPIKTSPPFLPQLAISPPSKARPTRRDEVHTAACGHPQPPRSHAPRVPVAPTHRPPRRRQRIDKQPPVAGTPP